ncbi:DNA polymerase III subunit alpha [Rubrivivax gelatinosus]|uniref:DNA polymerase III subunit alpha n=1 Tax=Rubrivivax gelatinosus TaxID=28068 RepID=A0ABS1DW57_RUBGE|nr:DNA polymerase III subunit alpha [Rubrivivax gelatinosus]MBK1713953.1 DNA polymerase III subunit alpha [Rubrivivax gelatinosus]
MPFVHLRTHTEFSVVDGTLRIDDAAAAARADGQPALAITDLSNLFGAIKFYKACRGAGVKPIVGVDVWMDPLADAAERQPTRLVLLVQDRAGYLNLCELLARAWTQNVQRNQAWLKWEWLRELSGGLIALSGADMGAVGQALLNGDLERAAAVAQELAAIFPQRFYLELQRAGLPTNEAQVRAAVPLAARLGLPVVATHPIQFQEPDDFEAHEARVCIAEGETLANPKRIKRFTREQHFKTAAQMQALFADVPSALANTVEIARRCNLTLVLGKPRLPDFPTPDGSPIEAYFRKASHEGLEKRLAALFPKQEERDKRRPEYVERLEFELATILKMGFPGYFLIVSDFIVWAKENGCPVGPGRGSGAGSLVAYALFITDLDPLQYKLLFERFLNPERVSMPDFDIDFCQGNRDRVIRYVKEKYGRDAVGQIATFGTMAAKAALRDVGRVLGMGYGHVDSIAKLIPAPPGKTVTLAKVPEKPDPGIIYARQEEPEIDRREAAEEEVAELLSLATRVEGMVRNIGMHAGGVLIAPGKITDFCPLYQQPGSDSAVSQYDKDDVEAIGLVKFDFLGLATLTILELARQYIVARRPNRKDFSYETLPLDDQRVYKLFSDGLTEAVFQFESRGMQGMLREAKPSRLEDLIALNALYRPGPMDLIPTFVARKHGKEKVEYPHPLLETVLGETYGVMVYQEQVMQTAQVLGGYSLGGADLLRRAMGKKKAEEMAEHRVIFREGAAKKNIPEAKADEVFDLMEKFAGYGFNKSHAAAYSLLAYHTAWIKVHCTAEFFAANMTIEADNTDKLKVLLADAKLFGISFDPPDVNRGTLRFEPIEDKRIRYGLGAIKGTGAGAIEAICAAREGRDGDGGGPFRSLFDFCARVDRQRVNKRVVEALIKAGAFDSLHPDRAATLASVSLAFEWADAQAANADQCGLFDFGDAHGSSTQEPALVAVESWQVRERLMQEKVAIGFYLSGHLFDACRDEVRRFVRRDIVELVDSREPQSIAGIVSELRVVNGQRGRVAIFKLDDGSEAIEAVANEELLDASRELLREDELVIVVGKLQPDRFSGGLRLNAQQIWDLATARARFGRYLSVEVNGGLPPVADVLKLWPAHRVETENGEQRQGLGVRLKLKRPTAVGEIDLGDEARFWPCDEALARWKTIAEHGNASIIYE